MKPIAVGAIAPDAAPYDFPDMHIHKWSHSRSGRFSTPDPYLLDTCRIVLEHRPLLPAIAAAATMTGDMSIVLPSGEPCRPLKFRLDDLSGKLALDSPPKRLNLRKSTKLTRFLRSLLARSGNCRKYGSLAAALDAR
jgi:hypothetical protein